MQTPSLSLPSSEAGTGTHHVPKRWDRRVESTPPSQTLSRTTWFFELEGQENLLWPGLVSVPHLDSGSCEAASCGAFTSVPVSLLSHCGFSPTPA